MPGDRGPLPPEFALARPFLDEGPCQYPGCGRTGLRVAGALCPEHSARVLSAAAYLWQWGVPLTEADGERQTRALLGADEGEP